MTLQRHVQNGMIVLDEPVPLPEGAAVQVQLLGPPTMRAVEGELPTLAETLEDFVGVLEDLPEDAATEHDHYLYGTPKK
jgi:hypothetical protein